MDIRMIIARSLLAVFPFAMTIFLRNRSYGFWKNGIAYRQLYEYGPFAPIPRESELIPFGIYVIGYFLLGILFFAFTGVFLNLALKG